MNMTDQITHILDNSTIQIPVINNAEPIISFEEINDIQYNDIINNQKNIQTMLNSLNLCDHLKQLYVLINDTKVEYITNDWTIMALNDVVEDFKLMKEFTENKIVDFAKSYIGMGVVYIVAYDPNVKSFFIRRDGGSNAHDREANFNFFCNYTPQKDKHVDFHYILDMFSGKINFFDKNFKIVEN